MFFTCTYSVEGVWISLPSEFKCKKKMHLEIFIWNFSIIVRDLLITLEHHSSTCMFIGSILVHAFKVLSKYLSFCFDDCYIVFKKKLGGGGEWGVSHCLGKLKTLLEVIEAGYCIVWRVYTIFSWLNERCIVCSSYIFFLVPKLLRRDIYIMNNKSNWFSE
mgnify:CR=1 FL=1